MKAGSRVRATHPAANEHVSTKLCCLRSLNLRTRYENRLSAYDFCIRQDLQCCNEAGVNRCDFMLVGRRIARQLSGEAMKTVSCRELV